MSYYIHDLPGRLRIKSPLLKNNPEGEYRIRKILGTHEGIATIEINPVTGSLLINYNSKKIKKTDIIGEIERRGYFDSSKAITNDQYIHKAATRAGNFLGKTISGAFFGSALEGTPLSFLAVVL